ncbi:MAG: histidine ammonia-lyase [Phycisphaerae bacterium]|nr:histidine ammonia-lyase [Phycisphaerae bacterium]
MSQTQKLHLGDHPLRLEQLDAALESPLQIELSAAGLARARTGRAWVERILKSGQVVYGVNTGFGHLKNKRIAPDQLEQLQHNLLISHAVGVGPLAPPEIVRWMLLFKINMLLAGHSGVRPEVVQTLAAWLNADLLPAVPTRGSLGASGDLAPLAHLFLPLIGRGQMTRGGGAPRPAAQALAELGISQLPLAAKEGLALINGTQFMSSYGVRIVLRARRLLDLADLICALTLEARRGTNRHADAKLHALRAHAGALASSANILRYLQGSEILASHADCDRVQDPYSLRCAPQVHGAVRDAVAHAAAIFEREINSVTDNPIVFEDDVISGGSFHGAPLAAPLDYLAIALTDLGSISERRTYLLLEGDDKLPKLLMQDTGVNSGFMIPQYTQASLVNECKVLATPASIDTIPTSLGQEDHVSMGATAAVKCFEVLDRVEHILAIELLCAAQAIEFLKPLQPTQPLREAMQIVRRRIPFADRDREFAADIAAAHSLIRGSRELLAIARPS